ncbi:MAG: hypothetical protein OZX49_02016 [Immundisolibacter sp.]|nr:hypothetical protein [Immundisolibacter sp.]
MLADWPTTMPRGANSAAARWKSCGDARLTMMWCTHSPRRSSASRYTVGPLSGSTNSKQAPSRRPMARRAVCSTGLP